MFPVSGLFFSFLSVSVFLPGLQESTHRMKLLSNGSLEEQTLQTRKNKQSQNQAFSCFVVCSAAAETQACTWGKSFFLFLPRPHLCDPRTSKAGKRGGTSGCLISQILPARCLSDDSLLILSLRVVVEIKLCLLYISLWPRHPYLCC